MKRFTIVFLTLLLAFGILSCDVVTFPITPVNDYTEPSHWTDQQKIIKANIANLHDSVLTFYRESASYLAERVLYNSVDSLNSPVQIPTELTDLFYHGLLHIYNTTSISARDTIMELVRVQPFSYRSLRNIIISVDAEAQWLERWFTGDTLTGNVAIDSVLQTYNLYPTELHYTGNSYDVYLHSELPINTASLAAKFRPLPDIQYATPEMFAGDGNDITAQIGESYLTYQFYIKWGDCPAGCINQHHWEFHVSYNGSVSFEGSFGDPVDWLTEDLAQKKWAIRKDRPYAFN